MGVQPALCLVSYIPKDTDVQVSHSAFRSAHIRDRPGPGAMLCDRAWMGGRYPVPLLAPGPFLPGRSRPHVGQTRFVTGSSKGIWRTLINAVAAAAAGYPQFLPAIASIDPSAAGDALPLSCDRRASGSYGNACVGDRVPLVTSSP